MDKLDKLVKTSKIIYSRLKKLKMPTPAKSAKILVDFFELTLISAGVFMLVYIFIAQLLKVNGDSMFPTFKDGEQLISEKLSIRIKPIVRGDIVVFKHPQNSERFLIKRVVGMPNDVFTVSNGLVFVNGATIKEPYVMQGIKTMQGAIIKEGIDYQIPKDEYILLGDNRDQSSDSRDFGAVSAKNIIGRVLLVYYPVTHFRIIWY